MLQDRLCRISVFDLQMIDLIQPALRLIELFRFKGKTVQITAKLAPGIPDQILHFDQLFIQFSRFVIMFCRHSCRTYCPSDRFCRTYTAFSCCIQIRLFQILCDSFPLHHPPVIFFYRLAFCRSDSCIFNLINLKFKKRNLFGSLSLVFIGLLKFFFQPAVFPV